MRRVNESAGSGFVQKIRSAFRFIAAATTPAYAALGSLGFFILYINVWLVLHDRGMWPVLEGWMEVLAFVGAYVLYLAWTLASCIGTIGPGPANVREPLGPRRKGWG